ncbi:glycosyltransferase family 39 protein [Sulfurimonas sp. HSL-1716]|uniref:glycosyltransferase family 39 protein n=1 Tax=Hydrocurvibacter sulfurireducens TaxID=3131937 RepID=UPI0031F99991
MKLLNKEHYPLFYFIASVAVIRLLLSAHVGLGVDEAHYVLYGLNLNWSYFDHPPLVGWTEAFFTSIFGVNEFGARIGAVLIGFFTSLFVYKLIYEISKSSSTAFFAVLALHASFLFNALFIMLLPDTFLFLLVIPIIFTVVKVEKTGSLSSWIQLGILLGLGGLAKYTAVLFIIPIILYVLIKRRWDMIFTFKIIPAVFIALVLISPVIYWNIEHDWISFTYQSGHVVGESRIDWKGFFGSIAAQFGAYNPLLFPVAFFGLYKALKSKDDTIFLSGLFGLVLISFFTYASLHKPALPHWSALFYLLFIPMGTYYMLELANGYKKYLRAAVWFGLVVSALAYAELGFKMIPLPDYQSLHRDIYGWDTILKEANGFVKDKEKDAIAVTNWTLASRAIFYDQKYKSKVYLIDDRYDQFDIWQKGSPIGKNLVIIDTHFFHKDISKYMKCDSIVEDKSFDIMLNSHKVNTVNLFTCKNYQGLK